MRILIAEDDPLSRRMLGAMLGKWGHDLIVCEDGGQAWAEYQKDDPPSLAVLDWMMPELDGVEVCRRIRSLDLPSPPYLILLTAKTFTEDLVEGLQAGADDYMTKPFKSAELQARIGVGARVLGLQEALTRRVAELQDAIDHVKTLQGLVPICMHCHKIRNDGDAWEKLEVYVEDHSEAAFSHSLCPECLEKHYPDDAKSESGTSGPPATGESPGGEAATPPGSGDAPADPLSDLADILSSARPDERS